MKQFIDNVTTMQMAFRVVPSFLGPLVENVFFLTEIV